jgi:cysteine-rich repeat protein
MGTVWEQQAELLPADGTAGDGFGAQITLDGNTAIFGVPNDDDKGQSSGSAYVFTREGTVWAQQAKLLPADGEEFDRFGGRVALVGDTVVIGARGSSGSGAVYVFSGMGKVWTEQAKLLPGDGDVGDFFGSGIALDGDTVAIGARRDGDNGGDSGSAYVFIRVGNVWTEQAKLLPADGAAGDAFGRVVALHGDTVVISADADDDNGVQSGSAYVFTRAGNVWTEQAKLLPADGAAGEFFGVAVAVHGDTAVIGAWLDDDNGGDSGSAYVFTRVGNVWREQAKLLAPDGLAGDHFGQALVFDGNRAVIGAPADDDNGPASGSAYVFRLLPCGDGILDPDEECDDGNNEDGDGCASDCTLEEPVPAVSYHGAIVLVLLLLAVTAVLRRGSAA